MNIQPIARISLEKVSPEPLDEVDKALFELRYEDAQVKLQAVANGNETLPHWFFARLSELLFFWNEAENHSRVAENLRLWMRSIPEKQHAEIEDLLNRPDVESIRQWLRSRDRWRYQRLHSSYLLGETDLVEVEGGSYDMGRQDDAPETVPGQEVELDSFFIAQRPVSARQFALYLKAHELQIPQEWATSDEAARGVSFNEAIAYCNWLSERTDLAPVYKDQENHLISDHSMTGFRLPTEAEWEYAARGGSAASGYRYSGSDRLNEVGDVAGLDPVGMRMPNELGIYDMSGGRAEWCWDWYADDYCGQTNRKNPLGPSQGQSRVNRGGDIRGAGRKQACTVYAREDETMKSDHHRTMNIGLRLIRNS